MPSAAAPGPLIARDDEVRRLADLIGLSDGGDGIGGAVVLGGDAGVGKSRLLAELSSRATQSGWRVLVGHCLDFGDAALPYLPFSEVFGRLAAEAPDRAEALVASDSAVGRLLPARRLLTDSGDRPAATNRAALFDAVQGALSELGRESPVLLVVEDVHWADPSTRELLTFLFSRPFDAPVAVVASYRSDDLHRRHPLRGALAQWSRLPAVTRMSLEPLDAAGTRAVVRSLRPQPLPAGELQRIVDRTEGNPFFVEELLAAEGSADQLPTDLADLLLVRLDELDEQTRRVLRAASVAGRRVSHELLLRGAGVDDATLDRALRAAVDANVLVAAGPDGYEFRHALLAESVYQDLLPGERVRLHAAYATALTTGEAAGTAAELARHARAAHDLRTATVASVRAGHEAMAVGGPDEAARHYELALELLAEPGVSSSLADGSLGVDQIDLVVRTCAATVAAGHLTRALALAQDQLHALSAHAATYDRARLIHAVASTALLTDSGRVDVLALTTEAVRLVPAEPPSALRAQLLTVHARANADRARHEDAARWAAEALHLAHRLDLPDVAADATTTMARLDDWAGDAEASRTALVRTVTEARAAGEVAAELRGLFNLAGLRYEQGQLSDALDTYQQTWDRARETGRPWAPYGSDARAMAAVVAHVSGDWQRTAQIVDVRAESPPGLAEAALAAVDMELAAGRGDTEQVALIQRVRPWWQTDGLIAIISGAAAIELHAQRGDLAAAQAMHDDVVSVVSALWENPTFQARIRLGALLLGHVASAAARTATSDRGELVQRGDELAARTHDVADAGKNGGRRVGPESEAWLARLAAEQARLHWLSGIDPPAEGDLLRLCRQAVDAFERFGHVYETARSRARLAAVLRATGQTADATQLVARARAVATRLGAGPLLVELRTLAGPGAALPSTVGPRRGQPLTAREQEVLALLAQGRSNREIAGRLFISAKTVSVHVSNILAKLGAAGRTEAVSLARGLQLLDDGVAPSDRG